MWTFEKSATNKHNYLPHQHQEICFLGRSNVGKSTLINVLAGSKVARVSQTPGRTQTINFFRNGDSYFVDLPGYGYARASKKARREMLLMIEEYVHHRTQLKCLFLLIDARIGPTIDDYVVLDYFRHNKRNFFVVITKSDKANQSQMIKTRRKISAITPSFLEVSARHGKNIVKLKKIIAQAMV